MTQKKKARSNVWPISQILRNRIKWEVVNHILRLANVREIAILQHFKS